jgi:hypothetical protein
MKLFFTFAILSLLFYSCASPAPHNPDPLPIVPAAAPTIPETVEPSDIAAEQPESPETIAENTMPDTVASTIVTPEEEPAALASTAVTPEEEPDTLASIAVTPEEEPAALASIIVTPEEEPAALASIVVTPEEKPSVVMLVPETVPELPERPDPPVHIMGEGMVPQEKMAAFLLWNNTNADDDFVRSLTGFYIEESAAEGINYDTAFAQMCLETGFLRYGGLVTPDMNNFCGLGATGPAEPGLVFPDPRTGVRAHIQHLKAYATLAPLNLILVDPRYYLVKQGSSPTIHGLSGTWAVDRFYSQKINDILHRLYEFSF